MMRRRNYFSTAKAKLHRRAELAAENIPIADAKNRGERKWENLFTTLDFTGQLP